MKLGIRSKLFFVSLGLIAVSVVAADLYLTGALDLQLTERIRDDLFVRAGLVAQKAASATAGPEEYAAWDALADELGRIARGRVTLVRKDGVVLGDSEVEATELVRLENHASRPEIQGALSQGLGSSVRYSTTVRKRMMYVAVPFQRQGTVGGTVRVALPLTEVDNAIVKLRKTLAIASLLALVVAILMSTIAAELTSRTLRHMTDAARKMADGDLATRIRAGGHDEIAALGRALDRLAESLSGSLSALRSERDLLGGILSGMQEGVLVVGRDGHIVLINPALRAMLLLRQEATGKSVLQTIRNAELNALLERARQGPTPPVEIELAGLKPRRVLAHAAALTGDPGSLLTVFVDVTELRRLESMRKEFVTNASHELRTPVAAVRSAAETLRSAMDDRVAASRFVDIIERNARRLENLVEDLLELSRIESREFQLTLEPVELPSTVSHVLSLYRERAEQKRIMLSIGLASELPPIRADRRALEQVCVNLIDNALKYCPEGARVTVRAAADGNMVKVAFEDNGPGIEQKHLPRLFERFYRVDAGRSRELGGTGLGLSIVKHLVEAMGGTVGVDSTIGKGTTFTVTFPRA